VVFWSKKERPASKGELRTKVPLKETKELSEEERIRRLSPKLFFQLRHTLVLLVNRWWKRERR